MTPPMTDDLVGRQTDAEVAAIAGKMSETQKRVLLAMNGKPQRAKEIPASGSTLMSLWDFGRDYSTTDTAVAPPIMLVTRDTWDEPLCHVWQIEPLGLRVAQHLKQENSHG